MNYYKYIIILFAIIPIAGCAYKISTRDIGKISVMAHKTPLFFEANVRNRSTPWMLTLRMSGLSNDEKLETEQRDMLVYLENIGSESIRVFTAQSLISGGSHQGITLELPQGGETLVFKGSIRDLIRYSRGIGFLRANGGDRSENHHVRFKFSSSKSFELKNGKIKIGIENSDSI